MAQTVQSGLEHPAAIGYDPFDYRIHEDPYPVYAWLRAHAPLYHNERRDFWALSRHADVVAALRDPARFSNRNGISLETELWGPHAVKTSYFLAMDPPEHGGYRGLVSAAFTPRRMAALEPRIRELARARLEPLRDLSRFDFAADYASALPNDVVCELLGVPAADWDQVRADTDQLNQRADGSEERGPGSVAAALRLANYFMALVTDLRRRPGDDLTSTLIRTPVNGVAHTDSQLVAFLFLVISAGNESTGKTIGNAWYHGGRQPDVQRQGLDGRAGDWANETLRYDSASQMTARTLTEETELHGTRLPAGARIAILPAAGNRDERVFAEPDRFDLDRDTSKLISFGHGPHHCLGAALARLEMRIALEEIGDLVSGYEIDVAQVRRVHSPHQRGFAALPCAVTRRPTPETTARLRRQAEMIDFEIRPSDRPMPPDRRAAVLADPGFGQVFTDHMVTLRWSADRGWYDGRLEPYGPFTLDPATAVFHYGQEIFEGLKAYRQDSGSIALFRPEANAARFNRSARRMAMPELPDDAFVRALELLVTQDAGWVPAGPGDSLYLRPMLIATQRGLGFTRPSSSYLFCVIASPASAYFGAAVRPLTVWLSERHSRAAPGGTGSAKAGGNYGGAFVAGREAVDRGCDQVVWLDAVEHRWVEEMGGMNLFFGYPAGDGGSRIMTPALTGTLLPGVTRDSLLRLAPQLGITAEEGRISVSQWRSACATGELTEVFACGTAAVLAPVGQVRSGSGDWVVGDGTPGPIARALRAELLGIQYGRRPDPFGWVHKVC